MTSEIGSFVKEHATQAAIATPSPGISGFSDDPPPINPRNLVWVALAFLVLAVAIAIDDVWLLNFIAVLLPANLLVYFEMRKSAPDGARIGGLMRRYVYAVAFQGLMQVAIIVVMARFVAGL